MRVVEKMRFWLSIRGVESGRGDMVWVAFRCIGAMTRVDGGESRGVLVLLLGGRDLQAEKESWGVQDGVSHLGHTARRWRENSGGGHHINPRL